MLGVWWRLRTVGQPRGVPEGGTSADRRGFDGYPAQAGRKQVLGFAPCLTPIGIGTTELESER
jgi:hypothetical protein